MTPEPRVRWARINRARVLTCLVTAVILSAWAPRAFAEAPYVVYTANATDKGAVILRSDPATGSLVEISRNGPQGNLFHRPFDVAVERDGDLIVADMGEPEVKDGAVIRVNPYTGRQTRLSSGGYFWDPAGITVGPDGAIYVIDPLFVDDLVHPQGGLVIRVDPHTGAQQLLSSNFDAPALFNYAFGIAIGKDGRFVVTNRSLSGDLPLACVPAGSLLSVNPVSGIQSLLGGAGLLSFPVGLAVDSDGSAVVANECSGGSGLVRVAPGGAQTQITANSAGDVLRTPERVGITPGGNYLVSDYNGGSDLDGSIVKVTRAGAQSTLSSGPLFNHPLGIAVVPNAAPVAALRLAPDLIRAGGQVKLDASGSRDPEGLQLVYEWDLDGNGSFETASGTTPTARPRFATGGTRTIRVRVNDPHGGQAVASALLRVDGSIPVLTRLQSAARTLKLKRSTTIRFRLSEPSTVTLALNRARRRGRAAKVVWARARTIKRAESAGSHGIRLRGRGLKPGHFKVVLTAVDAVGHRSSPRTLRLRVTR
jgi:DNA-binding beta-propeller fold protein YncE